MEASQSKVKMLQQEIKRQLLTNIYPSPSDELIKTKSRKPVKSTNQNGQEIVLHAQPSGGSLENIINHEDGRRQVQSPSKWPHSVHGVVVVKFEGIEGKCFGTGTLIGPHIVLTAGHNLYNHQKKVYAQPESIQFLPGIDVQMLPFGIAEIEQYFVSPKYVDENKEDYGILILKEPVGEKTGYFGLICPESGELTGRMLNVTGYPRDKVKSKPQTYEMWEMEGPAAYIDKQKGLIQYPIDTAAGQSGSGVWYQEGEDYYVCGIHQGGNLAFNQATLLTKSIYQQIHTWLQKIPNKRFLVWLGGTEFKLAGISLDKECLSCFMTEEMDALTTICFWSGAIGTEAMVLAHNTSWVNLSHLNLRHNEIGDQGVTGLAQNTSWVNLSHLDLSSNRIGDQGAAGLAQNTSWVNLSHLDLSDNQIGGQGATGLAQNTSWINLSHLDLGRNEIGDQGATGLAQNTSWVNLSHLNLSSKKIGDQGAAGLARNASWVNLSHLDFGYNEICDQGAAGLARNASWVNLSYLDLGHNEISDQGAAGLAHNTSWINLSHLDLGHNKIGDQGAAGLAHNTSWINLSHLDLSDNQIVKEGIALLTRNTSWVKLSSLDLRWNHIVKQGGAGLAQSSSWNSCYLKRKL